MTPLIRLTGATAKDRFRYGTLIKQARIQRGMTQGELAEAANVSRKTISNLENGTHAPQEAVLRRMFAAVGLATEEDAHAEHITAYMEMFGTLMESVPEPQQLEAMNRTTKLLTSYFERATPVVAVDFTPAEQAAYDADRVAASHDESEEELDPDDM